MVTLGADEPLAVTVVAAIHAGDLAALQRLLAERSNLASARLCSGDGGTSLALLHAATDWPGHVLNGAAIVAVLIDGGADIEAPGAVIGGGTPLADAVGFGQWQAARRLVERAAQTTLWLAAALGLLSRVEEHFAGAMPHAPDEVTNAFWCACHGGAAPGGGVSPRPRRRPELGWIRRAGTARRRSVSRCRRPGGVAAR